MRTLRQDTLCTSLTNSRSIRFSEFIWLWNKDQSLVTPRHHFRMALWLERSWRAKNSRAIVTAFRGSGKSSLVALLCSWHLLRYPDERILILAATESLAILMSKQVRTIIERHPLTRPLVPANRKSWSQGRFRVAHDKAWRDDSVLAVGLHANITGLRADIIIGDDLETHDAAQSSEAMRVIRQKLSELEYIVTSKGHILFIGTPHSLHSLYDTNHQDTDFDTRNYTRLSLPVRDEKGELMWPEYFCETRLAAIEARTTRQKFQSQMLLRPPQVEARGLDHRRLQWYADDLEYVEANREAILSLGDRRIVSGTCVWDPAMSARDGCASVVACVLVDDQGLIYIHDLHYLLERDDAEEDVASAQCQEIITFVNRNYMPHVYVEQNGCGQFLPGLLRRAFREQGGSQAVISLNARKAKHRRIEEAFDTFLAARRLWVHRDLKRSPWYEEFLTWRPDVQGRVDGMDALAHCLSLEPIRFSAMTGTYSNTRRPRWRLAGAENRLHI